MTPSLADFIGPNDRAALARPVERAESLPNIIYTSEDFARLENERLFPRLWVVAGYAHDIAGVGDIQPVAVAGRSVLLLRDRKGGIRAYLNSCRHRGMELFKEPCRNAKVICCPYHSWTYELDGRLKATPHFEGYGTNKIGGNGAMDELGLIPVRCAVWHDWIFVNLDGKAPPFEDYIAPFTARFADYDMSALRYFKGYTIDTAANWKLIMENFIEPYHIGTVHPLYNKIGPFQDYEIGSDGHCYIASIDKGYPENWKTPPPAFSNLPEERWFGTENCSLFPTFWITAARDFVLSSVAIPVSADRTDWRWDFYFIGDDPDFEAARKEVSDYHDAVVAEDPPIIEGWQRGVAGSDTARGRFSPAYEHHVRRWQEMLVETMA